MYNNCLFFFVCLEEKKIHLVLFSFFFCLGVPHIHLTSTKTAWVISSPMGRHFSLLICVCVDPDSGVGASGHEGASA
jgi:hypothetical protein